MSTRTPAAGADHAPVGAAAPTHRGAGLMLAMATIGFAVTFWAWALLSPLGSTLREQLGLSALQQALLVAVPVLVGSLGRIPVGALTDRLGARRMFPSVALLTVLPVLYLGHFAHSRSRALTTAPRANICASEPSPAAIRDRTMVAIVAS